MADIVSDFLCGKIAVCPGSDYIEKFAEWCDQKGIKWADGKAATEYPSVLEYAMRADTVDIDDFSMQYDGDGLHWASWGYFESVGISVVTGPEFSEAVGFANLSIQPVAAAELFDLLTPKGE